MITRVAGAFAVDPQTREEFISRIGERFARNGPVEVWDLPAREPVLTLVFATVKRPALSRWQGIDGSCAIIDGDYFDILGLHERRSDNPAETVFAEFKRGGIGALRRLRADAATLVFDAGPRRLTLARDLRGIGSLYYSVLTSGLFFASDQVTLADLLDERTLDPDALDYFLARGYVPAPWTLMREVRKLAPAHLIEATSGAEPRVVRYGSQTGQPKLHLKPEERSAEMGRLLTQALRRRLPAGAASGVLLSGGIDSALVTAALVKLVGAKPDCFTFEYTDYEGAHNEAGSAARIAAHYGLSHHRIVTRPKEFADRAASLVHAYGEPFTYGLHSFALDRLSGGPNPIFTGVGPEPWGLSRISQVTSRFRRLPKPLRHLGRLGFEMAQRFNGGRISRAGILLWSEKTGLPPATAPTLLSDGQRRSLYIDEETAEHGKWAGFELLREGITAFEGENVLDQWRILQGLCYGAEAALQWNTIWARNYGLSLRHPYMDDDLNAFMARITFSQLGKENQRNYALTLMPEEFVRAPKVFHTIPIAQWFRGPLRDFIRSTLESRELEAVFDRAAVTRLLDAHLSGEADHAFTLWGLASFALWS